MAEAPDASGLITLAEAAAHYQPFIERNPAGLSRPVRERLDRAFSLTAIELARAQAARPRLREALAAVFRSVDVLAGATLPAFPPPIGQGSVRAGGEEIPVLQAFPRLTSPANLAGVPAITIPCGGESGLPAGFQLLAGWNREDLLLRAAGCVHHETAWHAVRVANAPAVA
jgi:Asp-tRNA(Asn)/Glu-tRNA(Gln) amidotransferase A subunit family amidase